MTSTHGAEEELRIKSMINEANDALNSDVKDAEFIDRLKSRIEDCILNLQSELRSINRQYDSKTISKESFDRLAPSDFDIDKFNNWKFSAERAMRAKTSQISQLERALGNLRETSEKAIAYADVLLEVAVAASDFVGSDRSSSERDVTYGVLVEYLEKLDRHWPKWGGKR